MNYHIIPQDKFFHTYIEDVYKIGEEANNIFFVLGNEGDSNFFHTDRPVEYLGYDENFILEKLSQIKAIDKLFVAWYDVFIADIIIKSGIQCKVYSFLTGGEYYNDPPEYHDFWTYDSQTRYFIRRKMRQHGVLAFPFRTIYKLPYYIYDSFKHSREIKKKYRHKLATLERLDYIVTPKNAHAEVNFIRKLYPTCHAKHAIGDYDQNVDLAGGVEYDFEDKSGKPLNILLGNSADPMNNHMDALKYLRNKRFANCKIFCPLSYGVEEYKEYITNWLKKTLEDRFVPLYSYMMREEYIKFLTTIDVVVMNHNRQQASGNIISALVLGKPVFMKKRSVLYSMLKDINIHHVYDINELKKLNIDKIRLQAYMERDETLKKISNAFSEEVRLVSLKNLLCS